jgi:hypothetical protein
MHQEENVTVETPRMVSLPTAAKQQWRPGNILKKGRIRNAARFADEKDIRKNERKMCFI